MKPQKLKIFSDVTEVSRGARKQLYVAGLINEDDTVVSWARLAGPITSRTITETQAKQLVVLELTRVQGLIRDDILARLVNYLTKLDREEVRRKIENFKIKL